MAEVLGIVSGALAVVDFTTKIGGVGISLKRLLDECNDMPDTLLRKAEQIQEWNELFDEAERQIPPDAPPALARNRALLTKFASKFRAISTEIQVMIDKLLDQSTTGRRYKRKIGAAKAVLRKDDIKALDAKLDEALAQFQLALSLYTAATLMTNPILAIERQEENVKSPDNGQHEDIEKSDDEQNTNDSPEACSDADGEVANRTLIHTITDLPDIFTISPSSTVFGRLRFVLGSRERFQFSLRTPDWLSSSVYSLIASKSITGWRFHLRAYEVIPTFYDIGLIKHFRDDNGVAILKFLDEHRMSPFVRTVDGMTLLHMACRHGSVNFISLLLEMGIKLPMSQQNTGVFSGPTWLWSMLLPGFQSQVRLARNGPYPAQKILQMLRDHGVDEEAFDGPKEFLASGQHIPHNVISNLMGNEYFLLPVRDRLRHARQATSIKPIDDFELFLSWLPEARRDPYTLLKASRQPGVCSFIHTIVRHMAVHLAQRRFDRSVPISQHRWFEPVRKYVALDIEGANHIDDYGFFPYGAKGRTPLNAIFGLLRASTQSLPQIQWPVQLWVLALFSCGVDLLRYGRNEKLLHQQQVVKYGRRISNYATKSGQPSSRISVIAITYGSRPEHWRVWWAFEYEDFAGDFWHLIEQSGTEEPKLAIPGSWIEEPVNPMDVENDRVDEWYREERPPLIWSEYRKIRPPT